MEVILFVGQTIGGMSLCFGAFYGAFYALIHW